MEQRRQLLKGLAAGAALWAVGSAQAQTAFRSTRIGVTARGRGPDVILIPGLASTADVWAGLAGQLQGRRRLHLMSVRGFGDLAPQANADGAVMAAVAAEVRRYIAEQRLDRPALIG